MINTRKSLKILTCYNLEVICTALQQFLLLFLCMEAPFSAKQTNVYKLQSSTSPNARLAPLPASGGFILSDANFWQF